VADSLATLLKKARDFGFVKGLVPELVEGGLTHLQYADDTVICLEVDDESIANIKFLLYYFENMPGLKIDCHKSEVMVLGVPREESAKIARLLNCREGTWPMRYLGIPISNMKLYSAGLMYVEVKIEKRRLHGKDCTYRLGGVYTNGEQFEFFTYMYNGGILLT
jgi:hypothetical protein